jgi:hypothetical protein
MALLSAVLLQLTQWRAVQQYASMNMSALRMCRLNIAIDQVTPLAQNVIRVAPSEELDIWSPDVANLEASGNPFALNFPAEPRSRGVHRCGKPGKECDVGRLNVVVYDFEWGHVTAARAPSRIAPSDQGPRKVDYVAPWDGFINRVANGIFGAHRVSCPAPHRTRYSMDSSLLKDTKEPLQVGIRPPCADGSKRDVTPQTLPHAVLDQLRVMRAEVVHLQGDDRTRVSAQGRCRPEARFRARKKGPRKVCVGRQTVCELITAFSTVSAEICSSNEML